MNINIIAFIFLNILLLSSCSNNPINTKDSIDKASTTNAQQKKTTISIQKPVSYQQQITSKAIALINSGDIFKAIKSFEKNIKNANKIEKNNAYLSISEALFDNEYYQLSERYFEKTDKSLLNEIKKNHYQVLLAGLLLIEDEYISSLKTIKNTIDIDDKIYAIRKFTIQTHIYKNLNRPIEEVKTRIQLNRFYTNNLTLKSQNELKIWQILNLLPLNDLLIETSNNHSDYQAWLQFALIKRQKYINKETYTKNLQNWFEENKNHPSILFIYKINELLIDKQQPPKEIAIMLPVTGKYKLISRAILEGIFNAYYDYINENPNQAINISIYDTGENIESIWPIYNQIKKDKKNIIIGPLQKQFVDQLLKSSSLPIPVLTLNYSSQERLDSNLFDLIEFGLRPEDEATQIADYTASNGLLKTIAIIPRSNLGQRMLTTFKKNIEHHGGKIINQQAYSKKQKDFSRTIKQLIGINQSQNRYRRLKTITGESFEFEPRIRQDVDNIFLVANNKQAKLIVPQFKFFQAEKLPIYANSQVFNINSKNNSDLNNIKFLSPPWVIKTQEGRVKKYQKFIALGADSFNILSYLQRLKQNYDFTFQGEIGLISMDTTGKLHRQQQWATIKHGKLEKIDLKVDNQKRNRL